ncbi:MAG: DUF4345 family protein [Myxococcales bacterium]|nr:DUF4345 family protein [Myxococcales bacterium]
MPRLRVLSGLCIAAAGVFLIFSPMLVASALGRPHGTQPELINLRATWGGAVLGVGGFLAWLPSGAIPRVLIAGLLGWAMAGIAIARAIGFVLDGGPDTLQWVWLLAEIVIAIACFAVVRRSRGAP